MNLRRVAPPAPLANHATAVAMAATLALVMLIGACNPATTPSPTSPSSVPPPPSASTGPGGSGVASADAAAALVLASDPRFAGLAAQDPNLIGQCCFYTAVPAADGYAVTIEIGWGDCPAGCINRHHWFYGVTGAGSVHLDREDGPPVPAGVPGGDGTSGVIGIRGVATKGPVCPVARPNDPACADQPVQGALVHVIDATGTEVATLETDATGAFVVTLQPGQYRVQADPVEGLMGTPAVAGVTVTSALAPVALAYDTGIR